VKKRAELCGIHFDNYESLKLRVNGRPGVKHDLGNACWDSLCLYSDGHLYPSASFAGYPALDLGDAMTRSIQELWLESPLAQDFRQASVIKKANLNGDTFKYMTGGGDIEHSYFFGLDGKDHGDILGEDPYYPLYGELMKDVMHEMALQKRSAFNLRSGYHPPLVYHVMGEGAIFSGAEEDHRSVTTLHSNCVLSFDVELPRKVVQEFYGKAAEKPQAGLCCPVNYQADEVSHIPNEVMERFYGCGSPVTLANLKEGETLVDLGSGGGIDCFIAAKKVGATGRVIGVDMTDQMLEVANRNKQSVGENLGYHTVEFRKGYLEEVPVKTGTVDCITSNCVINLSPDKPKVFSEMWRILKDHGRVVVSDIVSEESLPLYIRANEQLLGECIAGALTEEEFISALEQAGFYGLTVLKKVFWKEIEDHRFYSVTVQGYKYEKKVGCVYIGQKAIYHGPFKATVDEEGHLFPRNEMVEICTDTAAKLKNPPYAGVFTVIEPERDATEIQHSYSVGDGGSCEPGCC
jgi:7,8-dihydro-6-hydroxymethylpterin dimethyltransferase